MADNILRINPSKPSTLEFEVKISGVDKIDPQVRFVVHSIKDGIDWSVKCKKGKGSKWIASFPTLTDVELKTCKFSVEVVVDEYFFVPAEGELEFINSPDISFGKQRTDKPIVTTSFQKQDEDIKEAVEDILEDNDPTNALLVPEENPEFTEEGEEEVEDEFDPESVAESILQHPIEKPKGSLFSRGNDGKIRIPGLESPLQKQQRMERERKIREALGKA